MVYATCHPDKQHFAHGLCNTCWQRARYKQDPEPRKAMRKRYYAAHRAEEIDKARARYQAKNPGAVTRGPNSAAYGTKPKRIKGEPRARRAANKPIQEPERPPAPVILAQNDKDWWKMTDKERNRYK